jgi:hypothetical protein
LGARPFSSCKAYEIVISAYGCQVSLIETVPTGVYVIGREYELPPTIIYLPGKTTDIARGADTQFVIYTVPIGGKGIRHKEAIIAILHIQMYTVIIIITIIADSEGICSGSSGGDATDSVTGIPPVANREIIRMADG